jgi:hypothetical protein
MELDICFSVNSVHKYFNYFKSIKLNFVFSNRALSTIVFLDITRSPYLGNQNESSSPIPNKLNMKESNWKKMSDKKKSNDKKKGWTFILVSNLVSRASIILNQ